MDRFRLISTESEVEGGRDSIPYTAFRVRLPPGRLRNSLGGGMRVKVVVRPHFTPLVEPLSDSDLAKEEKMADLLAFANPQRAVQLTDEDLRIRVRQWLEVLLTSDGVYGYGPSLMLRCGNHPNPLQSKSRTINTPDPISSVLSFAPKNASIRVFVKGLDMQFPRSPQSTSVSYSSTGGSKSAALRRRVDVSVTFEWEVERPTMEATGGDGDDDLFARVDMQHYGRDGDWDRPGLASQPTAFPFRGNQSSLEALSSLSVSVQIEFRPCPDGFCGDHGVCQLLEGPESVSSCECR